jgi:N6-L-threonylcarbamoyladenine synthase
MKILAIETSCDETSASVLTNQNGNIEVLSNITATSLLIHAKTGGIIPENAARMQVTYIMPVIVEALCTAGDAERGTPVERTKVEQSETSTSDGGAKRQDPKTWIRANEILKNEIDAIAVTYGPGLIGSLLVGIETAKTLSFIFEKPLIPVNHLLAHIYANFISPPSLRGVSIDEAISNGIATTSSKSRNDITFPFIGLIVSGGHTDLLLFERSEKRKVPSEASGSYISNTPKFTWLGGTRDDAAGEAFDKIGRLLNLSYPAGPEIERRATLVKNSAVKFQSPMIYSKDFDFSFSGLKAEALRFVQQKSVILEEAKRPIGSTLHDSIATLQNDKDSMINQICFATQKAILDVLVKKTLDAAEKYNAKMVLVGGGVSANETLITQFKLNAKRYALNPQIFSPEKIYCTDNAAMVGAYALKNYKPIAWQKVNANPELYFA